MTKLDIIVPGPEIETDPAATALWDETGKFVGAALARMERSKAFSVILGGFSTSCAKHMAPRTRAR